MMGAVYVVAISLAFLVVNVIIQLIILALNKHQSSESRLAVPPALLPPGRKVLEESDILCWEFEYARTTASEAMQDRHTMMNFYLVVVAVVISGAVAVLGQDTDLPKATATVLLWLLVSIGWFYFLMLIRLRQSWYDSVRAMNQLKEFYIQHAKELDLGALRDAFRWKTHTIPQPQKAWTVYFYSAMLIGFLDSVAYVAGGVFLLVERNLRPGLAILSGGVLILFGLVFFGFHIWLYFVFLKPPQTSPGASQRIPNQVKEDFMSLKPSQSDETGSSVKILELSEDYRFDKLFRVIRAKLQYRRFDGQMSEPVIRLNFERGDSVGVLLYDPGQDDVVLVRQFRYPVYAGLLPEEHAGDGARQAWLLEIVAGIRDEGREVKEVAHQELLEEAGYKVKGELQPITTFYPSPGGSSERISLFMAEIAQSQQAGAGGGVVAEGEDTQVVVLPFRQAMDMIVQGEIRDGKTIIALQYLALRKAMGPLIEIS